MANEKVLPLEQIVAASTPTDSARIVIHDSAGSANYIDLATLKRLVRESIQIGGRNLLKGTKDWSGGRFKDITKNIVSEFNGMDVLYIGTAYGKVGFAVEVEEGEQYAFSAWIDKMPNYAFSVHPSLESTYDGRCTAAGGMRQVGKHGEFIRVAAIFTCTKSGTICPHFESANAMKIAGVKLERGNIPTDWTPAPEDWGGR